MAGSQVWVTGANEIYVGFGAGSSASPTPSYLGTAEYCPKPSIRRERVPVRNSLGGRVIPFDVAAAGEHAFISMMMTRWDEAVYALLAKSPGTGGTRGTESRYDRGTLMLQENYHVCLWIQFPYSNQAAFSGMPAGYRFVACDFEGPDEYDTIGQEASKLLLHFHAYERFAPATRDYKLYDFDMTGLPAPT